MENYSSYFKKARIYTEVHAIKNKENIKDSLEKSSRVVYDDKELVTLRERSRDQERNPRSYLGLSLDREKSDDKMQKNQNKLSLSNKKRKKWLRRI